MNAKFKTFARNFARTFFANAITFLISALVVLIVPKQLGGSEYGYFQLYTLYTSYVGFFHFGWCDGVYLRYGGRDYDKLSRPVFISQFWMLTALELIIGAGLGVYGFFAVPNADKGIILAATGLCTPLVISRTFISYVLQLTNRIKEYASIATLERTLYFALVVVMLLLGVKDYRMMIIADLAGKAASLAAAVYICHDIVFGRPAPPKVAFGEARENIGVGFKLMFANVASLLIVGTVRLAIERQWNVETFGKVSLTLSISNLLMVFINAVSLILFPALRRTSENKLPVMYTLMRNFLMTALLGMLIIYYPAKIILSAWLPNYSDALTYMALMFPICIFESKTAMLVTTYLKTLRKEKTILLINAATVGLSVISTAVTVFLLKSLTLAVLSIVALQAFRCVFGELLLSKALGVSVKKDVILEIAMAAVFIASSWFIRSFWCMPAYAAAYAVYLFVKRHDLRSTFAQIKGIICR